MKKIFFTTCTYFILIASSFAQETVATSEVGKKMYVGLAANYAIAMNQHLGGALSLNYYINSKIGIDASYSYSYSQVKFNIAKSPFFQNKPEESKYTGKGENHVHYGAIGAKYFVLGSTDEQLSVYAGLGVGIGIVRSTEYTTALIQQTEDNPLNIWRGLYLPISAGVEYGMGPGKLFAAVSVAPRIVKIGTQPDGSAFGYLIFGNIGYKIGF